MEDNARGLYIKYRKQENKDQILRLYFNFATENKYELDEGNFMLIMFQVLDQFPGLEEDIEEMYVNILIGFDKYFGLTFVTEDKDTKIEVNPGKEWKVIKERFLLQIV